MITLLNVVGARPNFMKIAPLIHEIDRHPDIGQVLVHTGQHYDPNLSQVFFDELDIPRPDINLEVGSGSREEQIARISAAFEPVMLDQAPDAVLVVGDVNSTIACAAVARRHGVKIVHVEAGLRSFDMAMPEEHNRRETDAISDFLFVTEPSGLRNLEAEDNRGKRFLVGNVMIDTLVRNLDKAKAQPVLEDLGLTPGGYLVATFHRPANVDSQADLRALLDTLRAICARAPLVLPLHPRTRHSLARHGLAAELGTIPDLVLSEPLGYLQFMKLLMHARCVITDSGGIQEETTYLGVPCLTMRENTERPVTVDVGTNTLVGSDRARLLECLDAVMGGTYKSGARPELWDGGAAERIVAVLREELARA